MQVNVTALMQMTRLAVKHFMKQPGRGAIINTCSIAGTIPSFTTPVYSTSKWATLGFTRSMERLQEVGIRVVGLAPAAFETKLWSEDSFKAEYMSKYELVPLTIIADAMMELIQKEEAYPGGTILESHINGTRIVPLGPVPYRMEEAKAKGVYVASNKNVADKVILDHLLKE